MPTVGENVSVWNASYDGTQLGKESPSGWGGPDAEWHGTFLPRIHPLIPVDTILELGPGNGRRTELLKDYCANLIVVDFEDQRIEACKKNFSSCSHITYHVNDGRSLDMIPDKAIDFVFSSDSLVHEESDVLEAYLSQLAKKLKPNGIGFIHHSNLGIYSELIGLTKQLPRNSRHTLLSEKDLIDFANCHADSMTAKLFEEYCDKVGMQCVSQELINWFSSKYLTACFSIFTPKNSVWARPNRVFENTHFMDEVKLINARYQPYCPSPLYECFHDGAKGELVWGWAWDKNNPYTKVAVDIYDGETLIAANVEASKYRSDVIPYTQDNGCHAFVYELPDSLKDGQPHSIRVRVSATGAQAFGSPKVLTVSPKLY